MSEIVITVRGTSETAVTPERAVARVSATADGPERGAVIARIALIADPIRQELDAASSGGSVSEWTSQRMTVWTDRPWSPTGEQLPDVHHASLDITATFTDAAMLSSWLTGISARDGVTVGGVDWQLTPQTRARVEREVAIAAVSVAIERAGAYAAAIGRDSVAPIEIADLGLLGTGPGDQTAIGRFSYSAKRETADAAEFRPDTIVISAAIEARFRAQ